VKPAGVNFDTARHYRYRARPPPPRDSSRSGEKVAARRGHGNRPKIMHSVHSVVNGNLQLFTTSDRVEARSAEGNAGLDETRHGTPPPLKIRRRWRITFTLDDSMESRDRADEEGRSFTSSWLARNLSGCHRGIPSVSFSWRARSWGPPRDRKQ